MDRPNRVPRATPGVAASPVDTAVFAGQEGAPAMPTPLAKPQTQPDLFDAQQKMEMVRALGGLSESLRGATFAAVRNEQIIGGQYEEYGEQMGAIAAYMNSEGRSFTEALSQDQIEALDHPRAQLGMARGSAGVAARGLYKDLEANLAGMRVGDHAKDIGHYAAAFDNALNRMAYDYSGPRPDLFRQELITASLPLRDRWVSENRAWINTEIIKDSESNLINATNDIMEATFGSRRDVIVESSLHDPNSLDPAEAMLGKMGLAKTQRIIGVSDKEHFDRRVEAAAAAITKMIDSEQGGLISSSNLNEIVAMQLIDLAKNSSELSGFAEAVLLKTETGPEDSRASILTGRSKDEYLKSKDAIKSRQNTYSKSQASKAFRGVVTEYKRGFVANAAGLMWDKDYVTSDTIVSNFIQQQFGGNQTITLEDGTEMVVEGEDILFYAPESYGLDSPQRWNKSDLQDQIEELVIRNATENELGQNPQLSRTAALAHATSSTKIKSKELTESLQRGMAITNRYRNQLTAMPGEDDQDWNEYVSVMNSNLEAYEILVESNGLGQLDSDTRLFYEELSLIRTDPHLRSLAGNTMESALFRMSNVNREAGQMAWTRNDAGVTAMEEVLSGENYIDNEGLLYIERVSKLATNLGAEPEQAVRSALNAYNTRFIAFPGGGKVDSHMYNLEAPIFEEFKPEAGDWDFMGRVLADLLPGTKKEYQQAFEMFQQTGLATPDLLNATWDALISDGDFKTDLYNNVAPILAQAGHQTSINIQDGKKRVTDKEVFDEAVHQLKTNPPDWFTIGYQTVGEFMYEDFRFVPLGANPDGILFFALEARTSETSAPRIILNENNLDGRGQARPFFKEDIIDLYNRRFMKKPVDSEYMTDEQAYQSFIDETPDYTGMGPTYD